MKFINQRHLTSEELAMRLSGFDIPVSLDVIENLSAAFGGGIDRAIPDNLLKESVAPAQNGMAVRLVGNNTLGYRLLGDPSGKNEERAHKAMLAVDTYVPEVFYRDEALSNLLTGLMHYCDSNEYDFQKAFASAHEQYARQVVLQLAPATPGLTPDQLDAKKPEAVANDGPSI